MVRANKIYTKQLKQDLKKLSKRIEALPKKVTERTVADIAHLSFDDTETIPFATEGAIQLVMSNADSDDSTYGMEVLLAKEAEQLTEDAMQNLRKELKGVVK